MLDYKHAIRIDFDGFLNRIKINASTDNMLQVRFIPLKNEQTLMLFDDGTMVTHRGKKMIILHDGCILNFDNRRNFAMTYAEPKTILQQNVKSAYIH